MKETGNKVTVEYEYDGMIIYLEIEVQSIQEYDADKAVSSIWGVGNVTVNGDGEIEVKG